MAKRGTIEGNSGWVEDEEFDEEFLEEPEVNLSEEPSVQELVLLKNIKLKITGKVTGNVYMFPGAGSSCLIDVQDVPYLLSKDGGASCCGGGSSSSPYFQVVGA